MCGIVGLHLREPLLYPELGRLVTGMLGQVVERGPDSAGIAVYGDHRITPPGSYSVSVLTGGLPAADSVAAVAGELAVAGQLPADVAPSCHEAGPTTVVSAQVEPEVLLAAVRRALPGCTIVGHGSDLAVLKGVGHPLALAEQFALPLVSGWQAIGHTRMATESAVTPQGSHPFSVGPGQCLVHNGSFANHATIRRELAAQGVTFDSENDSEVGARFIAHHLEHGVELEKALRMLCERFDGFYTLLVSTEDSFAVVRDAIACKPAIIAETPQWVAMASEYRALAGLPGVDSARIFEPEPEEVYVWQR